MMLEESAQIIQCVLDRYESGNLLVFALRLLRCVADDRGNSREDQYLIRVPAKRSYP
ncbi:hypothetical protein D3C74_428410 [compost metagenome]